MHVVSACAALLFGAASLVPAGAPSRSRSASHGLDRRACASGKAALLAMKIWEEETNAKGGLLGRPCS